jgi:hypothetical protein
MADTRLARWTLPVAALLAAGCSCLNPYCRGATGLLPPVTLSERDPGGPRLAALQTAQATGRPDARPADPYAPAFGGALAREVYRASSGLGFRVEVREILIGPGRKASGIRLAGPAVVDVRSGAGRFRMDSESADRQAGATFVLPEGQGLEIDNPGAVPITLRVQLFVAE